MEANLKSTFAKLAAENHLKGLDADAFANRAAYYLGELNAIHPFREGNGRAQREFIRELAAEAGYRINWNRVTRAADVRGIHRKPQPRQQCRLCRTDPSAMEPARNSVPDP